MVSMPCYAAEEHLKITANGFELDKGQSASL